MPLHPLRLILGLSLAALACNAQEEEAPARESIEVQLFCVPKNVEGNPVLQKAADSMIPIELSSICLSPVYSLPRPADWSVGEQKTGAGFIEWARTSTLDAKSQILALVSKGDRYQLHALDASADKFSKGDMILLNATDTKITAKFGKQKLSLEPGAHVITRFPADLRIVPATLSQTQNGKTTAFHNQVWHISRQARSLIVLYPDSKFGQTQIQVVRDFTEIE